jgi:hypothetical protein
MISHCGQHELSINVRVVQRAEIGEELLGMARRWQQQRGIEPLADPSWLTVTCEDDQQFAPGDGSLRSSPAPVRDRTP